MRLLKASWSGFRNLQEDTLEFSPRVNLVLGGNGEGKTNLLEALNFFALGRSHRGSRNEDLIGFDAESLHVRIEAAAEPNDLFTCEYGIDRQGDRRFRIDGQVIGRRADLVGRLATVFFNPESTLLVRGGPQNRRQYLDQGRSEIDPSYLGELLTFQRALRQKTSLIRDLKRGLADGPETRRELKAWNGELAGCAAAICLGRQEQARLLQPFASLNHNKLLDNDLQLELIYRPRLRAIRDSLESDPDNPPEKNQLAEEIRAEIDYIMDVEIKRGRPLVGPQFDDLEIRLGGVDLRAFGSQGETRTAAIALILARSDAMFEKRRVRPVLFFDDIFSELDSDRSRRVQEMSAVDHQVFIATARNDDIADWRPAELKSWNVEAGSLTQRA